MLSAPYTFQTQKNEILFLTAFGGTNLGLNKTEVLRTRSDSKVYINAGTFCNKDMKCKGHKYKVEETKSLLMRKLDVHEHDKEME